MNDGEMKSTRKVIHRRHYQLEQSLKEIESELEASLSTIEEMKNIRQKLRERSKHLESNQNCILYGTEVRNVEVKCNKGFSAYNCNRCKKTCEKPEKINNFEKKLCTNKDCNCPPSSHVYQRFALVATSTKVTTTQRDMKAEFEGNFKEKLTSEDLMAICWDKLNVAKGKVLSLLEQVGTDSRSLNSTALRSNALSPSKYPSLMRSRVLEEQKPGYLPRLQTLSELQASLNAPAVTSTKNDKLTPVQPKNKQPERKTRSCGRGRGFLMRDTISTVNPGTSQSTHSGKEEKSWSENLSGPSIVQSTGSADKGNGTSSRSQYQMAGINRNNSSVSSAASTASSNAQMTTQGTKVDGGVGRGRGRNIPSTQGSSSGSQVGQPSGEPGKYYITSKKTDEQHNNQPEESENPFVNFLRKFWSFK
jgi:hypothetical protein